MALTEEMKKYHRDWYHEQSNEYKQKKQELGIQRRKEIRLWIIEYKTSVGCSCGERDWRCLDFHHLGDKTANIADLAKNGVSKETLLKEMQKCIILCANCHRKETLRDV